MHNKISTIRYFYSAGPSFIQSLYPFWFLLYFWIGAHAKSLPCAVHIQALLLGSSGTHCHWSAVVRTRPVTGSHSSQLQATALPPQAQHFLTMRQLYMPNYHREEWLGDDQVVLHLRKNCCLTCVRRVTISTFYGLQILQCTLGSVLICLWSCNKISETGQFLKNWNLFLKIRDNWEVQDQGAASAWWGSQAAPS